MDSEFLTLLKEIENARKGGFVKIALYAALSVIDTCAKVEYPECQAQSKRYIEWCKSYLYDNAVATTYRLTHVKNGVERFAEELYSLRCNVLHESNIEITNDKERYVNPLRQYIITSASTSEFCAAIIVVNEPYQYQSIDIGWLVSYIYCKALQYYENAEKENREKLDAINQFFIDERNIENLSKTWSMETLNKRSQRSENSKKSKNNGKTIIEK